MKRIYHRYENWEDFNNGMYRKISKHEESLLLPEIIQFTADHQAWGAAMLDVVNQWQYSCEHNLTDLNSNRRAWVGQAACCLKKQYPEYLVREAWNTLSKRQQYLANKMADEAIAEWELKYKQNAKTQLRIIGF